MSWTKKNVHPGKIVSTSQEVEVMVLDVDPQKRRISLGLKQVMANPWEAFVEEHPVGSTSRGRGAQHHRVRPVRRPARRYRRHGPPVRYRLEPAGRGRDQGLPQGRDRAGQGARRRCRQGAHQPRHQAARSRPVRGRHGNLARRARSSPARSPAITEGGVEVTLADDVPGFIRKSELSRDRSEQRPDRFAVGEQVDAKVTAIDRATRAGHAVDQGARGR